MYALLFNIYICTYIYKNIQIIQDIFGIFSWKENKNTYNLLKKIFNFKNISRKIFNGERDSI